jgi:hypothetical protein
MSINYTEGDLDRLISEKIAQCSDLPNMCRFSQTEAGRGRITVRVKEIIFNDGIADIDAAFAKIEDELQWEE